MRPLWRNVLPVLNPGGTIVHISDCYSPRTGGIETQVANLVAAQREAGWAVEIMTATVGEPEQGVNRITAPIPFGLPIHPRTRARVAESLATSKPSVAHIHIGATSPFAWGAIRAMRDLNIPTVITVHSMWGPLSRFGYHTFANQLSESHFTWSAVSDEASQLVRQALNVPVHLMPNGIDLNSWVTNGSTSAHLRVVGVLRMAPRKRVLPWLSVMGQVQKKVPTASAVLVGHGPLLSVAQRYAEKHGIKVEFPGRLNQSQLLSIYRESDVFLQSSIRESFGIAALEARAAGLAVVAREGTGTTSFIVNGVNGFLERSDRKLADRLIDLACNPHLLASIKTNNQVPPPYDRASLLRVSGHLYDLAKQQ